MILEISFGYHPRRKPDGVLENQFKAWIPSQLLKMDKFSRDRSDSTTGTISYNRSHTVVHFGISFNLFILKHKKSLFEQKSQGQL